MEELTEFLKKERKEKGINQEEMAEAIGISQERYSQIESEPGNMNLKTAVKICEKLQLELRIGTIRLS